MNKCINCQKNTKNPKYCSRSCSATVNGRLYPKRIGEGKCAICGGVFAKSRRRKFCTTCVKPTKEITEGYKQLSIGEYRNKFSVKGKHPSWAHSHVRNFNRSWNKDLLKKPCEHCSYSKHVELAHIKEISSYPDSALLGDINHPNNIKVLCPNCHWEFDNLPRS